MFSKVRTLLNEDLIKFRKFQDSIVKLENFGSKKYNKPQPPNYFMCIRLCNENVWLSFLSIYLTIVFINIILFVKKVIKAVENCQSIILKNSPDFKNAAIKIPTLHITLFAMHLKDMNQIDV